MTIKKVNLEKLKGEIDNRKQERNMVSSSLGESVGTGVAPRDVFLHGLVESLNKGTETAASNLIKNVENTVAAKKGEQPKLQVSRPIQTETVAPVKTEMSPERDELLFNKIEQSRKNTLAESINSFNGTSNNQPQENVVNYNGQQLLTAPPVNAGVQINEGALNESVRQIVNTHLVENLSPVLEEAIKNTVIEMYAVERIKEVLNENKDLIKTVVYETIRELQKRKK